MKIQLSIRDLFWLVLVAAFLCAWRVDHISLRREISEENKKTEEAGRSLESLARMTVQYRERADYLEGLIESAKFSDEEAEAKWGREHAPASP